MTEHVISKDFTGRILLPDSYEIWECDHSTGSLIAIPMGGITSAVDLQSAFNGLTQDPEMASKHLITVKCTRRILDANFPYKEMLGLPITEQARSRGKHRGGKGKVNGYAR